MHHSTFARIATQGLPIRSTQSQPCSLAPLLPCYNDATCTVGETQAVISTEATSQVHVAFIRYAEDLLFCYTRSGVDMLQADTKKMEPHPTSRLCSLLSADMTCIRS